MKKNLLTVYLLLLTLTGSLLLSACGGGGAPQAEKKEDSSSQEASAEEDVEEEDEADEEYDEEEEYEEDDQDLVVDESELTYDPYDPESVLNSDDIQVFWQNDVVTFIGGVFYPYEVNDIDDAYEAIQFVLPYLGGGEETGLEAESEIPTESNVTYYSFHQTEGDIVVTGSTVKLIVGEGSTLALVSSLTPGLGSGEIAEWGVTAEEAEAIVKETLSDQKTPVRIIPNATYQTMLPEEESETGEYHYVWAVFTNNIDPDYDMGYMVNYVDHFGEYLYYMPVTSPDSSDAVTGDYTAFVFDGMEATSWSGTVQDHNGNSRELEVPLMMDTETGKYWMGDIERKVLAGDYADFIFDDTLTVRSADSPEDFADNELITYSTFLQVYDFYADSGWPGPDGEESPSLILMDYVDEEGNVVHNACYMGKQQGFQTFAFNRDEPDGECMDVVAHEFTHCVTTTTMSDNLYENDYGAINEAMSDIMGNIVEAWYGATEDKTWLIMENGLEPLRSMSEPNLYQQPGYLWDKYYVPAVTTPGENNDQGGVHTNSSLLNRIAWLLNANGMPLEDQFYYWLNVALALTPRTDYDQITQLLPWCMVTAEQTDYLDPLWDAIEAVGIGSGSSVESVPEGLAMIAIPIEDERLADLDCTFSFINTDTEETIISWPSASDNQLIVTTDPGEYLACILYVENEDDEYAQELYYSFDYGWINAQEVDDILGDGSFLINAEEGELVLLDTNNLDSYFDLE